MPGPVCYGICMRSKTANRRKICGLICGSEARLKLFCRDFNALKGKMADGSSVEPLNGGQKRSALGRRRIILMPWIAPVGNSDMISGPTARRLSLRVEIRRGRRPTVCGPPAIEIL